MGSSDHPHGPHFSITWTRWNNNRNWKTCLSTAERRPLETVRSHWNLAGHSDWGSINIPKQPWQKPTVYHQQQSLSSLRCWRNGTPAAALATQLFQIISPCKLIYTKVTFIFWETQSILLPLSKVRSCTGRAPIRMQQLTSEGLEKAQGELGKSLGISPGSLNLWQ